MKIEKLLYFPLGNNVVIGHRVKKQLKFLKEKVPSYFLNRRMDDLGCGDGKTTLLLKDIFLPTRLRGFDVLPHQVKRAKEKGIEAEVKDLEKDVPSGELAIIWGVLHHIDNVDSCLKKIKENYDLIFIREPIKNGTALWFGELGHPFQEEEVKHLVGKYLNGSQVFYYDENIFIFWNSSKLDTRKVGIKGV
jgi:hypothetical protein